MVSKVVDDINSLGYDRITLKTDQEIAMTSLQAKVQRLRDRPVVLANSPKGDSQFDGRAEKALRDIEEAVT